MPIHLPALSIRSLRSRSVPNLPMFHAVQERAGDRDIFLNEDRLKCLDRGLGPPVGEEPYFLGRGLSEYSQFFAKTRFGKIEENVARRLRRMKRRRGSPVRLLTIGPGHGKMESELKGLFEKKIIIDTFSLTDCVADEHRTAFSTIYLGNIDTHQLPIGYDLIVSLYGSYHALDQARVFCQVFRSLNLGGEAVYNYYNPDVTTRRDALYPRKSTQQEFLRQKGGVIYEEDKLSRLERLETIAYMKKEREITDIRQILSRACPRAD